MSSNIIQLGTVHYDNVFQSYWVQSLVQSFCDLSQYASNYFRKPFIEMKIRNMFSASSTFFLELTYNTKLTI